MTLPPFMQGVVALNKAIRALDYEGVAEMLADPQIPVNLDILGVALPLMTMFVNRPDRRMTRLFLDCPRIDWLAPSCNRNLLSLERDFGLFKYYGSPVHKRKLPSRRVQYRFYPPGSNDALNEAFDHFYCIPGYFEEDLRDEIHGKIIDQVLRIAGIDDCRPLLFYSAECVNDFRAVLKRCPSDVDLTSLRDGEGNSLLCITSCTEVTKILVEHGAIEAIKPGDRPLVNLDEDEEDWQLEVTEWMLERGLSLDLLAGKGLLPVRYYNDRSFLEKYGMTEAFFRASLLNSNELTASAFNAIFTKYPEYQRIFESDLPVHLLAVYGAQFEELEGVSVDVGAWGEEDFLRFVESIIRRAFRLDRYLSHILKRADLIKQHANHLLHFAVKHSAQHFFADLVHEFGADAKVLIGGKTLLFECERMDAMHELVRLGADPFHQCDGYLFFERDDFSKHLASFDFLMQIHQQGLDLFSREHKSGKSLVDYLKEQERIIYVYLPYGHLDFPTDRLGKRFFEVLSSVQEQPDPCAPIDDEGNTALHYLCFQKRAQCSDSILLSTLNRVKNFSGKSALSCFIQNDPEFYLMKQVSTVDDFEIYLRGCEKHYGAGFLERYGPELLCSWCQGRKISLPLLKHLIEQKAISLQSITESGGNRSLDQCLLEACIKGKTGNEEALLYLLDCGFKIDDVSRCAQLLGTDYLRVMKRILDDCQEPNELIAAVSEKQLSLNETFKTFIEHPKINQARPDDSSSAQCTTLDLYFFLLGRFNLKVVDYLLERGVDARRIIGSGLKAKLDCYVITCFCDIAEHLLKTKGWTMEELQAIPTERGPFAGALSL